jgi:biotin carboxyl carrier protein
VLFQVEVNGRPRDVAIERHGGVFAVSVDGQSHLVSVARVDASTLSILVLGGAVASHEVGLSDASVLVDGVAVPAALATRRRRRGAAEGSRGEGAQRVTAPMPGKIVRVLVTPGDAVEPRQPVIVVEAMKMENELRAPRGGVVREVAVQPGASVEAGTILVVID